MMAKKNRLAVTGVAIADCLGDDGIESMIGADKLIESKW